MSTLTCEGKDVLFDEFWACVCAETAFGVEKEGGGV